MTESLETPVQSFINWTTRKQRHPFYEYEPWDGPDGKAPRHTPGGAKFQLSMMRSTKYMRMAIAANQIGKTYDRAIEVVMMMTGELPYAFQYGEGVDTGIARNFDAKTKQGRDNVIRFGRISRLTGEVIDHDPDAVQDGTWYCGNITGVGAYPNEKVCFEDSQQAWICSWKQARDDTWIDLLKKLIPEHCLDLTKGTNGYSVSEFMFYLSGNKSIRLKTYDQGWEKVESKMVHHIVLDEEPPDRRYYTGCVMHGRTLSFSFTPLRGMSWAYTDLYEKWIAGDPDIDVFQATKYDCPYNLEKDIEKQERQLKDWEKQPKIYGRFSQQEGRPYYDWELCQKYLQEFVPKLSLATIYPSKQCKTVDDVLHCTMTKLPKDQRVGEDLWEIYEEPRDGVAYWISADCARGSDDPDASKDKNVAYIFRAPDVSKEEDPDWPACAACLHTGVTTESFAWLCLYGMVFYNYALAAVETKGEDGVAFFVEIRDYPFWFKMTVVSEKNRKVTEKIGFDTNARTRTPLFNKHRKYINAHEGRSFIPHHALLIEQSKIIWLRGRPDHPSGGTSDCVLAWSLGLWVWEEARTQIAYNARHFRNAREAGLPIPEIISNLTRRRIYETKPIIGSGRGLDTRRRDVSCQENLPSKHQSKRPSPTERFHQRSKKSGTF